MNRVSRMSRVGRVNDRNDQGNRGDSGRIEDIVYGIPKAEPKAEAYTKKNVTDLFEISSIDPPSTST